MVSLQDHIDKLSQLIGEPFQDGMFHLTIHTDYSTSQEAREVAAQMRLKIKELHLLKKEIRLSMKELSAAFTSQRVTIGKTLGAGIARGLFGTKTIGAFNMARRNDITMQKNRELQPYQQLIAGIDNIILALEKQKALVEQNAAMMSQTNRNTINPKG